MTQPTPFLDSPLHRQLRAATKQPHHALDHHPLLAPLMRTPRIADYAAALAGLHGVYALAETAMCAFLDRQPGLFDYASRCKLPALEADLAALGHPPVPLPTADALPPPQNIGELVGMLYTIEGSTRGGRFIGAKLQQCFGTTLPLQFFSGYGTASDPCWEAFWAFADTHCPPAQYADAIRSATSLFALIKNHLDHCPGATPGD